MTHPLSSPLTLGVLLASLAWCGPAPAQDPPPADAPATAPSLPTTQPAPSNRPATQPALAKRPSPPKIPDRGAYVGVRPQDDDPDAVEKVVGRTLAIDHHYHHWNTDYAADPLTLADVKRGRIPLVSLNGVGHEGVAASIARGEKDAILLTQAAGCAKLGAPMFVRFGFEQNHEVRQFAPKDYVAAWRRVYGIYRRQGATNVSFVWSPSAEAFDPRDRGKHSTDPAAFYPGDDCVDWIGADGYAKNANGHQSFKKIFDDFYRFGVKHGKPMMVAEFGVSADQGTNQAAWLRDAADSVKQHFPQIKALVYWNGKGKTGMDYRITASNSLSAAFREMAADPYFAAGQPAR